ncbi:leucyl aminopeptidase [Anaerococcus porci]|uniref:Probable cytosol aminopeptidase n=1 Tax=Anaerococcus porci TaxID=2652269 RepID=A0A6N7VGQ2_9FIRM|nr:leucyl aminopeptidase [Anaerococcus porci]MDY3005526.1 leucyl aminopeptidase [Anaerococcus porci]MSS78628.1 leucyl aminopeptidase [Anaerococcus porci]
MNYKYNDSNRNLIEFVFENEKGNPFFKGNMGEIFPNIGEDKILLGLGKKNEFSKEVLKEAVYKLIRYIKSKDIEEISFIENQFNFKDKEYLLSIVEAIESGIYEFDHYKKEKSLVKLENINLPKNLEEYKEDLDELLNVLLGQKLAKDLVNLRSNDIYPETLANYAKKELEDLGVDVKIYQKDEILNMGLTAYYNVAKGSDNEPRFIVMEYLHGKDDERPYVYVGKGLTYDSGGYSIKTSDGMKTMNSDMGGSGTVIGAMKAISKNKLKKNIVGIVAACENSISGRSYKPGDIIKARNGMTIEVDNTDAEGRITLADAVNYGATEYNPELMIDLATLTGAVLVALAETYTGAITNNDEAFAKVIEASKVSDEKVWQLPNDPFIRKYNESENADIKNTGGRMAGSITAGQFIENFVENTPWVHLDIAGTAYLSAPQGLNQKGATGVLVKTLYNLAKNK